MNHKKNLLISLLTLIFLSVIAITVGYIGKDCDPYAKGQAAFSIVLYTGLCLLTTLVIALVGTLLAHKVSQIAKNTPPKAKLTKAQKAQLKADKVKAKIAKQKAKIEAKLKSLS